jgi:nucleoside-diphosphate-sugar epimerase
MKVLFIGGTGNISSACTRLSVDRGMELWLLNRGQSPAIIPSGARLLKGNARDVDGMRRLLEGHTFDVVVDWIALEPGDVERDVQLFQGRTTQFVFISSASVYQKPPAHYLVAESTPLGNPFWQYARNKIACEQLLLTAYWECEFPATIVRPSLTYGPTWLPCAVGGHDYTVVDRMKKGKKIVVHGDGQSLWTMTHNSDFAKGLVGLLGNPLAIGETFHITSDEVLTWDQIYLALGKAAGVRPELVHIPSQFIHAFDARAGEGLLGDKAYSVVFDNSKIKRVVPEFEATMSLDAGLERSMQWFDADPRRKIVNEAANASMDRIVAAYQCSWEKAKVSVS